MRLRRDAGVRPDRPVTPPARLAGSPRRSRRGRVCRGRQLVLRASRSAPRGWDRIAGPPDSPRRVLLEWTGGRIHPDCLLDCRRPYDACMSIRYSIRACAVPRYVPDTGAASRGSAAAATATCESRPPAPATGRTRAIRRPADRPPPTRAYPGRSCSDASYPLTKRAGIPTDRHAAQNSTARSRHDPDRAASVVSGDSAGPSSRTVCPKPSKIVRFNSARKSSVLARARSSARTRGPPRSRSRARYGASAERSGSRSSGPAKTKSKDSPAASRPRTSCAPTARHRPEKPRLHHHVAILVQARRSARRAPAKSRARAAAAVCAASLRGRSRNVCGSWCTGASYR